MFFYFWVFCCASPSWIGFYIFYNYPLTWLTVTIRLSLWLPPLQATEDHLPQSVLEYHASASLLCLTAIFTSTCQCTKGTKTQHSNPGVPLGETPSLTCMVLSWQARYFQHSSQQEHTADACIHFRMASLQLLFVIWYCFMVFFHLSSRIVHPLC